MKRLLYIAIIAVTFSACSGDRKINKAAAGYGQADAQTLIETAGSMTLLELEGYILGVKATEYDYRESGHEKAADSRAGGCVALFRFAGGERTDLSACVYSREIR